MLFFFKAVIAILAPTFIVTYYLWLVSNMKNYSIDDIKNFYWKIENINKKHKLAHGIAEIYYCAHMLLGLVILLLKIDTFNSFNALILDPPIWFGVLFPLLTLGKYSFDALPVVAALLCYLIVPAAVSALLYLLFSTPVGKMSIKKNPYKGLSLSVVQDKIYRFRPDDVGVVRFLKDRVHGLVWVQAACFSVIFLVMVIYAGVVEAMPAEEVGTGIFTSVMITIPTAIFLYMLRLLQKSLYTPMYKLFHAIYLKRVKKPLNDVKQCKSQLDYADSMTRKYHAKLEAEKKERQRWEDHVRTMRSKFGDNWYTHSTPTTTTTIEDDPMGLRDPIPVDGRGI